MNAMLLVDFYKTNHHNMYPKGTTMIYSNLTARKSRIPGVDKVVVWGVQYLILEWLIGYFEVMFFDQDIEEVIEEYSRHVPGDTSHIRALHKLGYLPVEIKSL